MKSRRAWYLPLVFLIGLVFIYPALRTLGLAFLHQNAANGFHSEFAGLANFKRIAGDSRLINTFRVTAILRLFQ